MQLKMVNHRRNRNRQAGFTLTELLVATTLGLVLLANVGSFHRFQLFALRNQATQLQIQTDARNFADLFAREVRRAGMNPTCAGGISGIVEASSSLLHFRADLNGNGAIDATDEDVTYRYNVDANTVQRTANGVTDTLLSGTNLSGSRVRYFNAANAELVPASTGLSAAQRAAVVRVRLELAMAGNTIDPQNSSNLRAQVASDVDLRNRFFIASMPCPSP